VFLSETQAFDTSEDVIHSVGSANGQHTCMFVIVSLGSAGLNSLNR